MAASVMPRSFEGVVLSSLAIEPIAGTSLRVGYCDNLHDRWIDPEEHNEETLEAEAWEQLRRHTVNRHCTQRRLPARERGPRLPIEELDFEMSRPAPTWRRSESAVAPETLASKENQEREERQRQVEGPRASGLNRATRTVTGR